MLEEQYLHDRLDDQIEWYGKKSQWNQKWYKRIKKAEITLAGSISLLTAFWSDYIFIKVYIVLAGLIISGLVAIHGLYNFHENWIEYRATSETLKHEKYMFLTKSGVYLEKENAFQTLVERVESIISHENINWAQVNKRNNIPKNQTTAQQGAASTLRQS
jgi:hypothetical protein